MPRLALASLAAVVLAACAAGGAVVARAVVADDTILNQVQVQDAAGDSHGGLDLSSVSATSYADGTLGLTVGYASPGEVPPGDTVQVFIDLDGNGHADLNLSLWPTGEPSYLDRWNGSDWTDIRELGELVQTPGAFSVRLRLSELRDGAGVPIGSEIGLAVATWSNDPATGKLRTAYDDWLPSDQSWIRLALAKPAATTTAPPSTQTSTTRLTVGCAHQTVHARLTPADGAKVVSVVFYVNGVKVATKAKAPYLVLIPIGRFKAPPYMVKAAVRLSAKTQTVVKQVPSCS